jgi:hypothetical protein
VSDGSSVRAVSNLCLCCRPSIVVEADKTVTALHELTSRVVLTHRVAGDQAAFVDGASISPCALLTNCAHCGCDCAGSAGDSSVSWVGGFEQKASHKSFFPHITLGSGSLQAGEQRQRPCRLFASLPLPDACAAVPVAKLKDDKDLTAPFSFKGSLELWQLGDFCTCRKRLAVF